MDIGQFRAGFPEFGDAVMYPDQTVEFWASVGESLLNRDRWAGLYQQGLFLFVAHSLVLASDAVKASSRGLGLSGAGVMASKSVGSVSVTYDVSSAMFEGAGNFNQTAYGRSFWQLAGIVGMGGYQV